MSEKPRTKERKTKYRIKQGEFFDYLQYLKTYKILGFKIKVWKYIPHPYYCEIQGRYDSTGSETYVNNSNCFLNKFIEDWPDIKDYLKYFKEEQRRLEENVKNVQKERRERAGKTINLN